MKTWGRSKLTHLNELLKKVSQEYSDHLVPGEERELKDLKKVAREIRRGTNLGDLSIRQLIDEGRRY
jgi:hypothetical protein